MKISIVTEIDMETGEYQMTFRNKSNPGTPMDLNELKVALLKAAIHFSDGKNDHIDMPAEVLN